MENKKGRKQNVSIYTEGCYDPTTLCLHVKQTVNQVLLQQGVTV